MPAYWVDGPAGCPIGGPFDLWRKNYFLANGEPPEDTGKMYPALGAGTVSEIAIATVPTAATLEEISSTFADRGSPEQVAMAYAYFREWRKRAPAMPEGGQDLPLRTPKTRPESISEILADLGPPPVPPPPPPPHLQRPPLPRPPLPPPVLRPPPAPALDPMAERARKLVEELRRVPSWWGVSFRGFTPEAQFGAGTRSAVARGLVPASRNLRMATENYTCAGAYAIVGPDGRAIESIAIKDEQEIVFLPGTFFQFIGDYEVDGFPIRLVNQITIDPADRAQVDWDNIRNRVAALHKHETETVAGNYRIYTPGKFVGDID